MRLEKTMTWSREWRPAWRVRDCNPLPWGPWCYSRRAAVWAWFKVVLGL